MVAITSARLKKEHALKELSSRATLAPIRSINSPASSVSNEGSQEVVKEQTTKGMKSFTQPGSLQ